MRSWHQSYLFFFLLYVCAQLPPVLSLSDSLPSFTLQRTHFTANTHHTSHITHHTAKIYFFSQIWTSREYNSAMNNLLETITTLCTLLTLFFSLFCCTLILQIPEGQGSLLAPWTILVNVFCCCICCYILCAYYAPFTNNVVFLFFAVEYWFCAFFGWIFDVFQNTFLWLLGQVYTS